jgi:Family of unknown function (DUF6477)
MSISNLNASSAHLECVTPRVPGQQAVVDSTGDRAIRANPARPMRRPVSACAGALSRGADAYDRDRMLPRLLPVGPDEIGNVSIGGRLAIVRRLAKALRGERARGRAGHWTYSLDRHVGLHQAFAAETTALRALCTGRRPLAALKSSEV